MSAPCLTVFSENIKHNYQQLVKTYPLQTIGAVVKANAYGLGLEQIVPILFQAGCKTFFVNRFEEGVKVRSFALDAEVFVFDALIASETLEQYQAFNLTPVFSTKEALRRYPCEENIAVRLDTGFNLAGLNAFDKEECLNLLKERSVCFLMSHLSCSEQPSSLKNKEQLDLFSEYAKLVPKARKSFSASFGINLGSEYLFDVLRTGAVLYGSTPLPEYKQVAKLSAPISWIRSFEKGESLGYNDSYVFEKQTLVASVLIGSGDGIVHKQGCFVDYKGKLLPVLSAPTTNYLPIDVSSVASKIKEGEEVDLFNDYYTIDLLAQDAGMDVGADVLIRLNSSLLKTVV